MQLLGWYAETDGCRQRPVTGLARKRFYADIVIAINLVVAGM